MKGDKLAPTRERILDAARALFNERGYDRVTMRAVSDSLGISVGNLTYHFAHKHELVIALMDDDMHDTLLSEPFTRLDQINTIFSRMLDSLLRNPFYYLDDSVQDIVGERIGQNTARVHAQLDSAFDALVACGLVRPSFVGEERRAVLSFLLMSHITWLRRRIRHPQVPEVDKDTFLQRHWVLLAPYLTEQWTPAR